MGGRTPPAGIEVVNNPKTGLGTINHNKKPMGIGLLAGADIVFKNKIRWTVTLMLDDVEVEEPMWVKISRRPQPEVEETEINFLSAKTWIPGKQNLEKITFTRYDLDHEWVAPCFNRVLLKMYNAVGECWESWDMTGAKLGHFTGDGGYGDDKSYFYEFDVHYEKTKYASGYPPLPWERQAVKNQVTIE